MGWADYYIDKDKKAQEQAKLAQQNQTWDDTMASRASRKISDGVDPALSNVVAPRPSLPSTFLRNFNIASDSMQKGATLGLGGEGGPIDRLAQKIVSPLARKFGNEKESLDLIPAPETKMERFSAGAGELIGAAVPITPISGLAGMLPKVPFAGLGGKVVNGAIRGGTAGAIYEGAKAGIEGQPLPEIAKSAGEGALMWGGIEAGLPIAGAGLKKGIGALKGKKVELPTDIPPDTGGEFIPYKPATEAIQDMDLKLPFMPQGNTLLKGMQNNWRTPIKQTAEDNIAPKLTPLNGNADITIAPKREAPSPSAANDLLMAGDNLSSRLLNAENAARQRITDRNAAYAPGKMNIVARDPIEDFKDITIIAASKVVRAGITFADFSKEMIAQFGKGIEPNLANLWHRGNELAKSGSTIIKYAGKEHTVTMGNKTEQAIAQGKPQLPGMGQTGGNAAKVLEPTAPPVKEPTRIRLVPKPAPVVKGTEERGFSVNTKTDVNNPDALRDSFSENPLTYNQLSNKDTLGKAQSIFDQGYESARTQLSELASRMQPEAIPLAKLLSRQATEAGNIQGAREIISEVAEKLTQAGQFGQAAKILREADPEILLMTIGKQLKSLNKEGAEVYGKKWKDVDLTPEELDMVSKIERGNQQSYEAVFEAIQGRIANELPSTVMEKVNAWRHISMLLNPKTQIRNVAGNTIMMGMRRTAKQVSAVLQNVALKAEDRTQVFKIKPEYQQAAEAYFEANKKDLLAGGNKYNEGIKLGMPDKRVFQNSALEGSRKLTYKLLEMGDTPFYKNAYINRLASYAQAKGIKDLSQLSEEGFAIAKKEAEEATYKDASNLASYLNKVKNPGSKATVGQKTAAFMTEAAMPFAKTPINVIKRGIQYSPAGLINGLASIKSAKGAAAAIDEMAKGLTGTAVLGLGYMLAKNGILTGKASKDADLKAYNANTGNSPFSIMGKYTYDWAQPFSVPLSVGVEIFNALKDNPQDAEKMNGLVAANNTEKLMQMAVTVSTGIYDSLAASGDTVFNMSVLKGIKNLLGNPQGITAGLAELPGSYAGQFVPTLSGQIAGAIDPTVRQTYVKGNLYESTKNTLLNKIPLASKTLAPKQTPFGQDVKRIESPLGRVAGQFLSPGNISVNQGVDPKIDAELRRLNESGLTNQFPTLVPNYIEKTQLHPRVNLTPEETTQYQKRVGELTLEGFSKIINKTPAATKNKTADEVKADLLAEAIADAKAQAKMEILKSKGLKYK